MKRLLIILFAIFIVSCTTLETRIYSLHLGDVTEKIRTQEPSPLAFLSVKAPRHLEQPYIIFRSSPYELFPSQYAKWDSAPAEIIREKFTEYLIKCGIFKEVRSARYRRSDSGYLVVINLRDFSRLDEPSASYGVVSLGLTMKDYGGNEVYSREFIKKERLEDKTYLSLAKGLSVAVGSILREMALDMKEVMRSSAKTN